MRRFFEQLFGHKKVQILWLEIRKNGRYIDHRYVNSFSWSLYALVDEQTKLPSYYEVWKRVRFNEIYWIENQSEDYVLRCYQLPN